MTKHSLISAAMLLVLAGIICIYFEWARSKREERSFQIGRVFHCSKVELIQLMVAILISCAAWFLGQVLREQDVYWTYKWQIAAFIMVPIAYIDFKQRIIPNKLLLLMLLAAFIIYVAQGLSDPSYLKMYVLNAGVGALLGGGVFFVASLISRNGVGAGDIKLYFVLGLLLSFRGIFNVLLYSTVISFVFAIVFLIMKKKKVKDELPLAPFTLLGVILSIVLGV